MKVTFNIGYRTQWGEHLCVSGRIPALGSGDVQAAVAMNYLGGEQWQLVIDLPDTTPDFEYSYLVVNDNGHITHEWGKPHRFDRGFNVREFVINDRWQDQPWDKPYYSSVFTDCVCRRPAAASPAPVIRAGRVRICVDAPMIAPDCHLAICGSCKALGSWDHTAPLAMDGSAYPTWSIDLEADKLPASFDYKFVIVKTADNSIVAWEGRDNRHIDIDPAEAETAATVFAGMRFVNPLAPWHGAGTAIPVFSLRTEDDFGVGDFMDLCKMVDWAADTHQRVLQLLPINDTTMTHTWTDSYPYNANSTFALHPMYLNLKTMGVLNDPARREYYDKLGRELNALETVDYERVNNAKIAYTHELFAQDGAKTTASKDFKAFIERNDAWLTPYAAFCVLRDLNGTCDMSRWGDMATYDAKRVAEFVKKHKAEIEFVYFQQYHLDKQMRHVVEYAHAHGVSIKGDIPIGISRTSVDAWITPRLFNLDSQAGAPPDDFSVMGQNWGFPTYNWEEMNRDGFAWWRSRFSKMSEYFDAYRIDHVLGFFRIWQIPMDAVHGLLGVFNPALPFTPEELRGSYDFWINPARQARPYIMDWFLGEYFGEHTDEARERFLIAEGDGCYRLRPEVDTQRKVADYFASQPKDDKNDRLCNGLMGLIDNVLFIEDPYEKGKYHPRIAAQFTYSYRALTDYERWCFDRLYNDFFYRRHNDFWYGKAMWKLPPLIDSNNMLCCAEDLGMIPDCVPAVMSALEILALEIQRMPKDPAAEFGDTWRYPYYSVCTTSTHDMGGIRQWWEEDREKTQHFYNNVLHQGGAAPFYAEPWVCEKILDLHVKSPSMLCIIPLQDWLSMDAELRRTNPADEVINVPANPRHYWRYRMHLTVEQLKGAELFNNRLRAMIDESGR